MATSRYRTLPSIDALASSISSDLPRAVVVEAARLAVTQARDSLGRGETTDATELAIRLVRALERSSGRRVVNATGVLLHTNLGRAPWSPEALRRAGVAASGYGNLELDLESGQRGRRGDYVDRLVVSLTGADKALVVNNNAAALLLALASLAEGKAIPVSRGELIEIGGSYRLPEVMAASGARLVEVGTTNRTRVGDYHTALQTHDCAAVLKVHPSNFQVEGFTEEVPLASLADLCHRLEVPLLFDLGSGLLDASSPWLPEWLAGEPAARQSLEEGADLVMFSADKLVGGPQAGVIAGRGELVSRLRRHPLYRALRVDGVVYAALAATLEAHLADGPPDLPLWRMALLGVEQLGARCEAVAAATDGEVEAGFSAMGGGSAPGAAIPSPLIRYGDGDLLHGCLLEGEPPILARRERGDLLVDLRTVEPEDDTLVAEAISRCR